MEVSCWFPRYSLPNDDPAAKGPEEETPVLSIVSTAESATSIALHL